MKVIFINYNVIYPESYIGINKLKELVSSLKGKVTYVSLDTFDDIEVTVDIKFTIALSYPEGISADCSLLKKEKGDSELSCQIDRDIDNKTKKIWII